MPGPYPDHDVDVLLTRYKEHAGHLRALDLLDLRVAGGFVTIQLAFGSWFVSHPVKSIVIKFLLLVIDAALLGVCLRLLRGSGQRRQEIVLTIRNINSALGLEKPGTYLPDRPVNPPTGKARTRWYGPGCVVAFLGAALVVWFASGLGGTPP
jgi:hypothetical protein